MQETIWFFTESSGEMGLRSNFEPIVARIGGVYGVPVTTGEMDGRMLSAASRYRQAVKAINCISNKHRDTIYNYAIHRITGVILRSELFRDFHRRSGTDRSPEDWLNRIEQTKSRMWYQLRVNAVAELERAIEEFNRLWRRSAA